MNEETDLTAFKPVDLAIPVFGYNAKSGLTAPIS
jgi:hypothetical protein